MTRIRSIRRSPEGRRERRSSAEPRRRRSRAAGARRRRSARGGTGRRAGDPSRRPTRTAGRGSSSRGRRRRRSRRRRRRTSGRSRSRPPSGIPAKAGWSRRRSTWFQPMWGSDRRVLELSRPARQHAKRRGAVLVAALEEQLEAEADPEERAVVGDPAPDRVDEPGPLQTLHCGRRRADAGHDERVGVPEVVGTRRADDVRPDGHKRLLDADEVARAVVDDREPRQAPGAGRVAPLIRASPSSRPLPRRRGSGSQAARSARPSALNAASARWWSFRPLPRTWIVAPAVRANASIACSTSWSGSSPTRSPRNGSSTTA